MGFMGLYTFLKICLKYRKNWQW